MSIDEVLRPIQTRDMLEKTKSMLKEYGDALSDGGEDIMERLREIEEAYGKKVDDYSDPQERLRAGKEFFSDPELGIEVADLYQQAQGLTDSESLVA